MNREEVISRLGRHANRTHVDHATRDACRDAVALLTPPETEEIEHARRSLGCISSLDAEWVRTCAKGLDALSREPGLENEWAEKVRAVQEAARFKIAALEAQLARVREAAEGLKCNIIHQGEPPGWTCADDMEDAMRNPEKRTPEYSRAVASGERLCARCRLQVAIADEATSPPAPPATEQRYWRSVRLTPGECWQMVMVDSKGLPVMGKDVRRGRCYYERDYTFPSEAAKMAEADGRSSGLPPWPPERSV